MFDGISLSSSTNSNLLALRNTTDAIGKAQLRLSTSLKVNTAVDDAIAFFEARTLTNQATDLLVLKDNID